MTHIGSKIKELRVNLGLTQAQLAKRIGKNISWVKNAETRTRQFEEDDISILARALEVDPRHLNVHSKSRILVVF